MAEVWPESWLVPEMKDKVIDFLRNLEMGLHGKKFALYEWCKRAGVEMKASDVEKVTGMKAGEV
jgi:hypothetical protein